MNEVPIQCGLRFLYPYKYKKQNRINKSSTTDLKLVLGGSVIYRKLAEFLCQTKALANIFRRDKIKCNLDA